MPKTLHVFLDLTVWFSKKAARETRTNTVMRSIHSNASLKHVAIIIIGHKMSQFRANFFFVYKQTGGRG